MEPVIKLAIDEHIATLTLNRPQSLNSLNAAMASALHAYCQQLSDDTQVRCVIIQGEGGHFMAGGDIGYFAQSLQLAEEERYQQVSGIIAIVHEAITAIRGMPKPVIASVSGAVAGFGISLMAACDLAIAAENSRFASAYCQLGVSPDGGNTYFLPRSIGEKRSKFLTFLGDPLDAHTALNMGLINQVVSVEELPHATLKLAKRLCQAPAKAVANAKQLLNTSLNHTLEQQLQAEQAGFAGCTLTADFAEGVRAFLQKRPPRFGSS